MASSTHTRDAGQSMTFAQTIPVTLTAVTITGVQDTKYDLGISIKKDAADGDGFMTMMFMDMQDPTVNVTTIAPRTAAGIIPGNRGTLAYTIRDAQNGITASGGGFTTTITNAYKMEESENYAFREFGKTTIPFGCISSDGQTSPVTITLL